MIRVWVIPSQTGLANMDSIDWSFSSEVVELIVNDKKMKLDLTKLKALEISNEESLVGTKK